MMAPATSIQRFETDSESATAEIASEAAARLVPGDVVLLSGELGSGKTAFVRGAARFLGVTGPVTSPTFAIGNVYPGAECEIAHLDLYRLADIDATDEAVVDDFLTPRRIGFVEWPHGELAEQFDPRLTVTLEHAGEDNRRLELAWREDGEDV